MSQGFCWRNGQFANLSPLLRGLISFRQPFGSRSFAFLSQQFGHCSRGVCVRVQCTMKRSRRDRTIAEKFTLLNDWWISLPSRFVVLLPLIKFETGCDWGGFIKRLLLHNWQRDVKLSAQKYTWPTASRYVNVAIGMVLVLWAVGGPWKCKAKDSAIRPNSS